MRKAEMIMRYINELHEGDRINGIYLCKQKQSAVTKNGKPYENVIIQDKTGMLDGKIWDPNSLGIDDFDALDYIEIMGDVTSFAGAMQLNIKRVRKAAEGEYNPADYLPVSENSTDVMYSQLLSMIGSVKNKYLSTLLKKLFVEDKEFIKAFEGHSAAKTVHHGFIGAYLECDKALRLHGRGISIIKKRSSDHGISSSRCGKNKRAFFFSTE